MTHKGTVLPVHLVLDVFFYALWCFYEKGAMAGGTAGFSRKPVFHHQPCGGPTFRAGGW
jgi:hypothetical protein